MPHPAHPVLARTDRNNKNAPTKGNIRTQRHVGSPFPPSDQLIPPPPLHLDVFAKVEEHAEGRRVVVVERKVRDAAVEALRRVRALRAQVVKFVVVLLAFFYLKKTNTGTKSRAHKKMGVCVRKSERANERGKQTKEVRGGECTWPPDRKHRRH
jgi:hypothetical protein